MSSSRLGRAFIAPLTAAALATAALTPAWVPTTTQLATAARPVHAVESFATTLAASTTALVGSAGPTAINLLAANPTALHTLDAHALATVATNPIATRPLALAIDGDTLDSAQQVLASLASIGTKIFSGVLQAPSYVSQSIGALLGGGEDNILESFAYLGFIVVYPLFDIASDLGPLLDGLDGVFPQANGGFGKLTSPIIEVAASGVVIANYVGFGLQAIATGISDGLRAGNPLQAAANGFKEFLTLSQNVVDGVVGSNQFSLKTTLTGLLQTLATAFLPTPKTEDPDTADPDTATLRTAQRLSVTGSAASRKLAPEDTESIEQSLDATPASGQGSTPVGTEAKGSGAEEAAGSATQTSEVEGSPATAPSVPSVAGTPAAETTPPDTATGKLSTDDETGSAAESTPASTPASASAPSKPATAAAGADAPKPKAKAGHGSGSHAATGSKAAKKPTKAPEKAATPSKAGAAA